MQTERNLADIDAHAAEHFGQLRAELYALGQPIGPYDMMIAGHARAMGLILVTNEKAGTVHPLFTI